MITRRELLKSAAMVVAGSTMHQALIADEAIDLTGRKILEYDPLPAPKRFHRSQAKNRWIMGGSRSGKSESCIGYDLCTYALNIHPRRTPPSLYELDIAPYTKEPTKVTI